MKKGYNFVLLVIFQLFLLFNSYSQNLILNSEFDEFEVYYDNNRNIVYHPRNWFYNEDTKSHPLYFSTERFLNPEIRMKIHPDGELIKQGNTINYVGFKILPNSETFYSILSESLVEFENYKLSIDIRPFGHRNCLTNMIVGFSESNSDSIDIEELVLKIPENYSYEYVNTNWIRLEANYKACGKEKFLIIGTKNKDKYIHFINSDSSRFDRRQRFDFSLAGFSLSYGIDNVNLSRIDILKNIMDTLKVNDTFILENIYFEFEKANLNENSYPTLLKLSDYLKLHKTVKIEIQGHTDNIGSKEFNDTLSFERAKNVRSFLVENGISENRLNFIGYGYEKPISSNDTDSGRQLNRRVEIKLLEK